MDKIIYLDNAATTKTSPEALAAMLPYFSEHYGNASTIYRLGAESKKAVTEARDTIAKSLGAESPEIYFTAAPRRTTGRLLPPRKAMRARESILSPLPSSIMPFCIPAGIWRKGGTR